MRSGGIDVETSFWLRSITRNDATQVEQESQLYYIGGSGMLSARAYIA
jgi:hypothetical protein